jgi:tRNA threonylcarbamoyladenosine biosynthesis protein TsaB
MGSNFQPTVLALDSAGAACSAALWREGALAARRWEEMTRGHAEILIPMVEAVVGKNGYGSVDLLCVGTGPGGYTGLRIALAAVRGLALATGLPVLGVANFDVHHALARRKYSDGPMTVILETRRADFYVQTYDSLGGPVDEPDVLPGTEVEDLLMALGSGVILAGDAVTRFQNISGIAGLTDALLVPQHADATVLAELGATRFADASHVPPRPLYLRPPNTSPPAADRQRLRG